MPATSAPRKRPLRRALPSFVPFGARTRPTDPPNFLASEGLNDRPEATLSGRSPQRRAYRHIGPKGRLNWAKRASRLEPGAERKTDPDCNGLPPRRHSPAGDRGGGVRRRPGLAAAPRSGLVARSRALADLVGALSVVIVLSELLGSVGAVPPRPDDRGAVVFGLGSVWWCGRAASSDRARHGRRA